MRRQDDRRARRPNRLCEFERIPLETRQGVGVEHNGAARFGRFGLRLQRGEGQRAGRGANAQRRPHDKRIHAAIFKESGEFVRTVADPGHDRGQRRRMSKQRLARRRDGHEPRPRAQGPARGETRGPRMREPARKNQSMAARIFIALRARGREAIFPDRRTIGQGLRPDRGENQFRNAYIGDDRLAAKQSSWQQKMAGLAAKKRDRARGARRRAADLTARAVEAGWNVHRENRLILRAGPFVEAQDGGFRGALKIAGEACAEKRVDGEVRRVQAQRFNREGLAGPGPRGGGRVAAQPVAAPKQAKLNGETPGGQQARGDKSVAAIIARAAKDDNSAGSGDEPLGLPGDRPARLLHQERPRNAGGDRQPVGFGHFRIGQKLWGRCVGRHEENPYQKDNETRCEGGGRFGRRSEARPYSGRGP